VIATALGRRDSHSDADVSLTRPAADWWTRRRASFNLDVSQLVVDEAAAGDVARGGASWRGALRG